MRLSPSATALTLALSLAGAATAQVNEYLVNGGFETGDFTGWMIAETGGFGNWDINDGSFVFGGPGTTLAPQNGNFDATSNANGPGNRMATQCFIVPNTVNMATLSWTDEIRNYATQFVDPGQEFRVFLADSMGVQIGAEIFSTNAGDPLIQASTSRSFDLTTTLQGLTGQTVCIVFEEEDSLFFMHVSIDDVSLLVDSPDTPPMITPAIVVTNGPACTPSGSDQDNLTFTPDGAGGYNVTNAGAADMSFASGTPLPLTDDSTSVQALGFNFAMPGGTVVTDIEIDSNGRMFQAGSGEVTDFSESVAEFLGDPTAIIAPFWDDLNPAAGGQVWFNTTASGVSITWDAVPEFGSTNSNTFQAQLFPSGAVSFHYISMDALDSIVGLSSGNGAADPGSMDLSAGGIMTAGGSVVYQEFTGDSDLGFFTPPTLAALTTPVIGTSFDLLISSNNPTIGEFYLLGNAFTFDLSPLGISCNLLTDSVLGTLPGVTGIANSVAIPNLPGLVGASLVAQGAVLDLAAGNPFFVLFTNSIDFTFGNV